MSPDVGQTKDRLKKEDRLVQRRKRKEKYPRYGHNLGTKFDFRDWLEREIGDSGTWCQDRVTWE